MQFIAQFCQLAINVFAQSFSVGTAGGFCNFFIFSSIVFKKKTNSFFYCFKEVGLLMYSGVPQVIGRKNPMIKFRLYLFGLKKLKNSCEFRPVKICAIKIEYEVNLLFAQSIVICIQETCVELEAICVWKKIRVSFQEGKKPWFELKYRL